MQGSLCKAIASAFRTRPTYIENGHDSKAASIDRCSCQRIENSVTAHGFYQDCDRLGSNPTSGPMSSSSTPALY
jgi:hypothetical protein